MIYFIFFIFFDFIQTSTIKIQVLDVNENPIFGANIEIINSELGKYFDHMKGSRKTQRKSARKDLMQQRTEKYWNEI